MLLKPNIGVCQAPLGKQGFRCVNRSPCLTSRVIIPCVRKIRRGKMSTYLGRFTTGGRRL